MYITPVNVNRTLLKSNSSCLNVSKNCNNKEKELKEISNCHYFSAPLFKGKVPLEQLMNDYRATMHNTGLSPVESFFKLEHPKESMNELLSSILCDDSTSYDFVNSIITQPRMIKHYADKFKEKLAIPDLVLNRYDPNNLYVKAHERYIESRYNNAGSISELIKIRPDWSEEALMKKHQQLYNNTDFVIGRVPESIGENNFYPIIEHLKK